MIPDKGISHVPEINRASGAAVGFIVGSLLFFVLAVVVKLTATVPAVDAARGDAFAGMLSEIRSNETVSLDTPGWIDRSRGIVRLPIATAEQLAAQEWRDPARARADLLARQKRASAPAPKVAPAANPFD